MTKIGIMGGSFDPIHYGHLITAQSVLEQKNLDKILFIPAGNNPFKDKQDRKRRLDCFHMVKKAIADNPKFMVSDIELLTGGKSYTYNTIKTLLRKNKNVKFYFIIGADLIYDLDKWYKSPELFKLISFIVMDRPGSNRLLHSKIDYLKKKYNADITFVKVPEIEISSTQIRNKIKQGKSIKYLTKPSVVKYIKNNNLYRPTKKMKEKIEEYKKLLKTLVPEKRYIHSLGVMDTAIELAELYNEDILKAQIAGLIHDCAKGLSIKQMEELADKENFHLSKNILDHPGTIHAPVGQIVAKNKFGIQDKDILSAISKHTTGATQMSALDKIVFLADYIEPGRTTPGVDKIRALAKEDLDQAVLAAMDNTINYLIKEGKPINPITIDARNSLRKSLNKNG